MSATKVTVISGEILVIFSVVLLLSLPSCGKSPGKTAVDKNPKEDARKALAGMGIEYTGAEFVNAARANNLIAINLFFASGMSPNEKGYGQTALMGAAQNGHMQIAELLLDRGADVNVQTATGLTALMDATMYGHIEIVQMLLDHGADPDARSEGHPTALTNAAAAGRIYIVSTLLASGADVYALPPTKGAFADCTAVMAAERHGHPGIARLLREAGAGN